MQPQARMCWLSVAKQHCCAQHAHWAFIMCSSVVLTNRAVKIAKPQRCKCRHKPGYFPAWFQLGLQSSTVEAALLHGALRHIDLLSKVLLRLAGTSAAWQPRVGPTLCMMAINPMMDSASKQRCCRALSGIIATYLKLVATLLVNPRLH